MIPKTENPQGLVGERSCCFEAVLVRGCGAARSENAGMSSELHLRMVHAESPRFPSQCTSAKG